MTPNIAVILAGGSGRRFGATRPKQFVDMGGRMVIEHTIDAFDSHPLVSEVVVVVHPDYMEEMQHIARRNTWTKITGILPGGDERQDSTLAALRHLGKREAGLIFHDAVRPLVSHRLITNVAEALAEGNAAVNTVLPMTDTVIEVADGATVGRPDRSRLRRVQTPQAFRADIIAEAYRRAAGDPNFRATDDCGVVASYMPEVPIKLVEGEADNIKLTFAEDAPLLLALLKRRNPRPTTEKADRNAANRFLADHNRRHLREMQLKVLDILKAIRHVCEKNDIPYWLDSGTLLGAVRHGGFIPWDDDIDICLPAKDLDRFCEAAQRDLPQDLFLQTRQTDPELRLPTYKVRHSNSFIVERGDDLSRNYAKGLFVDIFPMEDWPTMPDAFTRRVARGYCKANAILHTQHYYSLRSVAELFYFGMKRTLMRGLWAAACACRGKGVFYSNIIAHSGNGNRHRKDTVFPLGSIPFEGENFSAPAHPDRYLRDLFGDYSKLPPENQRTAHAVFYATSLTD